MRTILGYIKFISSRNLIFPGAVLVIMTVLFFALPIRDILFPANVSSFEDIIDGIDSGKRYINVSVDSLTYSGYDFYKGDDTAAAYYYILDEESADPICLFFLIPVSRYSSPAATLDSFHGRVRILKNNIYFRQFLNDFSNDIGWSSEGLSHLCRGALLSRYDYHPALFIILGILIGIIILICLVNILLNLITIIDPTRHEASRRLKRFGLDASDFRLIDDEIKNNCELHSGTLYVTEHYLVAFTSRSIAAIPLYNIVWIYKYSTLRKFSRNGKLNYSLMVVTDPSDHITIPGCAKKDADAVLNCLRRNYRHITVGYSEENRRKFEKK